MPSEFIAVIGNVLIASAVVFVVPGLVALWLAMGEVRSRARILRKLRELE